MILATGRTKELSLDLKKVNINKVLLNCWAKNFNGVSIFPNEYFSSKDIIKNLIDRKKIILQSFCLKNIGGKLMKIDYL